MERKNIIAEKSYNFALEIIKTCKSLESEKEFILSKQLLRSGTSIGANVEEAIGGQSKKDFFAKITIAYKEARESKYWIKLLRDSDLINIDTADKLIIQCEEILKIITAIQKTTRQTLYN